MKFDMGASTLSHLTKQTSGSHEDLGTLVRAMIVAAEPLEGKFNGAGRQAFDRFKENSDLIVADLRGSLGRILGGQSGMDTSFVQGDVDMADNASRSQGAAPFESARFGSSA